MSAPLECPELASWQALFDDTIPPEQGMLYERHLESCAVCQQQLDRAEECQDDLRRLGRQVGDPTVLPVDPTLTEIVERLQEEGSPNPGAAAIDLAFLGPSDKPGVLGTLGAYEVREVIGQGGMGTVLKAYEPALDRLVAIKVMATGVAGSATARQRFTREAQAAAAVCHDHIVVVHGVHAKDGLPYLVMQYILGESLQARLDRSGPLELREIVRIGLQTAQGLAAAHAQGLIHRDIKPANLLLSFCPDAEPSEQSALHGTDGTDTTDDTHRSYLSHPSRKVLVKITDFGLARMVDAVQITQHGVVSGTPEYMAPEQARGEAVDHRSDLFSLGSVIYAMCTGAPPFHAATAFAVLRQVSDETSAPLRSSNPNIPEWMEVLVSRLLAKDPVARFQSAAEVAELLEGYLADLQQPATTAAPKINELPAGVGPAQEKRKERVRSTRVLRYSRSCLVLLLLAGFGLFGIFALARMQPGQVEPLAEDVYQDFRGGQGILPPFVLVGVDAEEVTKAEKEGLRITLPSKRKDNDRVGIQLNSRIKGDFEITASYEILKGDRPTAGHGVGIELFVATDPADAELGLFRASRVDEGEVYMSSMCPIVDGKRQYMARCEPASVKSGRLRITRIGREAKLWVANGDAKDFELLFQEDLGPDDLKVVRVSAYPGHAQNELDLRIKDLRVRTLRPNEAAALSAAADKLQIKGDKLWLVAAGTVGLTTVIAGLAVWLVVRRRKASEPKPDTLSEQAGAELATPMLSVSCPGCGKKLKGKTEIGGKKVKCPECGAAVQMPAVQVSVSPVSETPLRKKVSRSRMWWLAGALLLLLVIFLITLSWWSHTPKPRVPMVNITLGSEVMPEVEESGFHFQEYDIGLPFRWTDGHGKLVIPIDPTKPPERLLVQLAVWRGPGVREAPVKIVVNGQSLFSEAIPIGRWQRVFDLHGIDLGEQVVLELISDNFNPLGNRQNDGRGASQDDRRLGLQIHAIKLIRDEANPSDVSLRTIRAHEQLLNAHPWTAAFGSLTSDGKTLVSGSLDGTVAIWNIEKKQPRIRRGFVSQLYALAVSPAGKSFATSASDRVVHVWDAKTGKPLGTFSGHHGRILALAYSPDGKTLASAGDNDTNGGELKLWDLATGQEGVAIEPFGFRLWGMAYAPDGKSVAVVGGARTAHVIDTSTGKELTSLPLPCYGRSVAYSPDGSLLAVAYGQDGWVRIHELGSNKLRPDFQMPGGKRILGIDFASDGRRLLTACGDGAAILWDTSGQEARPLARLAGHEGPLWWARFLPDGKTVLTGGEDRTIRMWSIAMP